MVTDSIAAPETFQRKPERITYPFICIGAEELARICNGWAPYTDNDGEWLASLDGPNDSPRVSILQSDNASIAP